jgi:hypothetical protein
MSQPTAYLVPQKRGAVQGAYARQRQVKVTRACDICKAKKSKCSGEYPCKSCSRRGLPCQYETGYTRGKAPSTPRAFGTLSLYRGSAQHRKDSSEYTHATQTNLSATLHMPSHIASNMSGMPANDMEPPLRASPGVEVAGQYSDPTSGLAFLHRAWKRISNKESYQVVNGQEGSTEDDQLLTSAGDKPFQEHGKLQIPSLRQCSGLLDMYFDVCIATYRLLHRPTAEAWVASVCENVRHDRPLFAGM